MIWWLLVIISVSVGLIGGLLLGSLGAASARDAAYSNGYRAGWDARGQRRMRLVTELEGR